MKIITPRPVMKPQALTTTPVVSDATLVDDTVALVDDPTALVGGNATIWSGIKARVKTIVPSARIKIRR